MLQAKKPKAAKPAAAAPAEGAAPAAEKPKVRLPLVTSQPCCSVQDCGPHDLYDWRWMQGCPVCLKQCILDSTVQTIHPRYLHFVNGL